MYIMASFLSTSYKTSWKKSVFSPIQTQLGEMKEFYSNGEDVKCFILQAHIIAPAVHNVYP